MSWGYIPKVEISEKSNGFSLIDAWHTLYYIYMCLSIFIYIYMDYMGFNGMQWGKRSAFLMGSPDLCERLHEGKWPLIISI